MWSSARGLRTIFPAATVAAGAVACRRKQTTRAESYWKQGFVPRDPCSPHAPMNHVPADGEKIAVSELGYVSVKDSGWLYPPFVSSKGLRDLKEKHQLRGGAHGDIVVASYPKCGTTWTQQILLLLLVDGDKNKIRDWFEGENTPSPWIERNLQNAECANSWTPPLAFSRRILKTHASADTSPWMGGASVQGVPPGAKIVVPTRNPADAAVSMYWHVCPKGHSHPGFSYLGSMSHFVTELWLQGNVESGDFWAWHASWMRAQAHLPADCILFISFEEMKEDLPGAIRRIADFCNIPCDDALVQRVADASGFKAMRKQFEAEAAERIKSGKRVKVNHIREGSKGGWRTELSPSVGELVLETHARRSREEGLPTDFFAPC
eukprot:TRINITY_DN9639_c0_g5_i1.p1 TRINITY_DN9639_c0_g5~~TRINITY_DN9639_c0_g5_i1.p1  ORF type:complete len:378 (-),score=57.47 TRINITY_DN9639_c0_g5_i1:124-1257(-)